MSVKAKTEMDGRIGIIEIKGSLVGDEETDRFRDAYNDLIEQGNKCLVINLRKVNYINSSGIGSLIGAHASYMKIGGEVKLAGLSNNVQNLLVVTKLIDIFDTHDTVEQATQSFITEKSLS
ncbi:MAG: anti-sigma factor antagonist [Bacteroidetes bacterium]|nr:MAG: anti-sigma factor antagonist [Bacteroidota bacterium]